MTECFAPEFVRAKVAELVVRDGCKTGVEVFVRIKQLQDETKKRYDNEDVETERQKIWKEYENYQNLGRIPPRQYARIVEDLKQPLTAMPPPRSLSSHEVPVRRRPWIKWF